MAGERGYIKLHRQITENELYFSQRFTRMQAWIDLLLLANYKPSTVFIRGIEIRLKPGQLCYSQETLAKRWRWNRKTVSTFLSMLSQRKMLDTKMNNITSVISIRNWNWYQESGQQSGHQKDTKRDTENKDKKEKKLIELTRPLLIHVKKESGLYSVIELFNNELGEDWVREIVTSCLRRDKKFEDENELARYLGGCKRNGHPSRASREGHRITDGLRTIKHEEPGWL